MKYNFIKIEKEEHILKLVLARPEKRNAFTPTMVAEIAHALERADLDESVYLIEISAEGSVFCAGMDILAFEDPNQDSLNPEINTDLNLSLGYIFEKLRTPSLCIIEGDVYAGGFLIFLGCTYTLASLKVKFTLPETQIGIFPFQVMESLLKFLPEAHVLKLCISPKSFDLTRALQLGLVDDIYKIENLEEYRSNILSGSPYAISKGMTALNQLGNISEEKRYAFLKNTLDEVKKSEDAQIGIRAWKEKKKPKWKNK